MSEHKVGVLKGIERLASQLRKLVFSLQGKFTQFVLLPCSHFLQNTSSKKIF